MEESSKFICSLYYIHSFQSPYRTTYASIRIVFQQVLASGRVGFGFALWKCNLYRNVAKRCWLDAKFLLVSEIATVQVTSSGTPFVKGWGMFRVLLLLLLLLMMMMMMMMMLLLLLLLMMMMMMMMLLLMMSPFSSSFSSLCSCLFFFFFFIVISVKRSFYLLRLLLLPSLLMCLGKMRMGRTRTPQKNKKYVPLRNLIFASV